MGLFSKLIGKKKKSRILSDEDIVNAGACPNCWGVQEYDGQYTEFVKDQTKDNINHNKQGQKAFVQQFVETNVTGIRLKTDGDKQVCPMCKGKYKSVSSHAD